MPAAQRGLYFSKPLYSFLPYLPCGGKTVQQSVGFPCGDRNTGPDDNYGQSRPTGKRSKFSPIPSQRRHPPATQKGTSAPSLAPISANAARESRCPVILFNPRRTAAASEEPPPMPASDGICFTSSMWTPPENPVSLKIIPPLPT